MSTSVHRPIERIMPDLDAFLLELNRASAAAIHAALSPGWCGHEDEVKGYYRLLDEGVQKQARLEDAEAEIARLREIEEAARALEAVEEDDESDLDVILFTLRGAGVLGTPMARILALRAALAPEASDD